jgi:hypothetical protein
MHALLPILVALPRLATQALVGQLWSTSPRPIVQDPGHPTREALPTLTADATLVARRSARSTPRSQTATTARSVGGGTPATCLLDGRPTLQGRRYKAALDLPQQPIHAGLFVVRMVREPPTRHSDQGCGGHRDSPQEPAPPAPKPIRDRCACPGGCQVSSTRRRRMA